MKYILVPILVLLLVNCTYGPVQEHVEIESGRFSSDASSLYVLVNKYNRKDPTGLSKFPDGGIPIISSREVRLFRCDLNKKSASLLKTFQLPESVWESFEPIIWSVADEGVYVLFTGCPLGGECYGPQNRREFYLFASNGEVVKISSSEPARNVEPESFVAVTYSQRVEFAERYPHKILHTFMLDPLTHGLE